MKYLNLYESKDDAMYSVVPYPAVMKLNGGDNLLFATKQNNLDKCIVIEDPEDENDIQFTDIPVIRYSASADGEFVINLGYAGELTLTLSDEYGDYVYERDEEHDVEFDGVHCEFIYDFEGTHKSEGDFTEDDVTYLLYVNNDSNSEWSLYLKSDDFSELFYAGTNDGSTYTIYASMRLFVYTKNEILSVSDDLSTVKIRYSYIVDSGRTSDYDTTVDDEVYYSYGGHSGRTVMFYLKNDKTDKIYSIEDDKVCDFFECYNGIFSNGTVSGVLGKLHVYTFRDDSEYIGFSTDSAGTYSNSPLDIYVGYINDSDVLEYDKIMFYNDLYSVVISEKPDKKSPKNKTISYNAGDDVDIVLEEPVLNISSENSSLTSVVVPDTVTELCENAFSDCESLVSINLPDNLKIIGGYAFYYCTSLASVVIPEHVTNIGDYAFLRTNITYVDIPDSVKSIGEYSFAECYNLESIVVSLNLSSIGSKAFDGCGVLTDVTIKSNDIMSKTYTSDDNLSTIFGTNVTKYTIGDTVTSIGSYAFSGSEKLNTIILSESISSIDDYAFSGCNDLTIIYNNTEYDLGSLVIELYELLVNDGVSVTKKALPEVIESYTYSFNSVDDCTIKHYARVADIVYKLNKVNQTSYGNTTEEITTLTKLVSVEENTVDEAKSITGSFIDDNNIEINYNITQSAMPDVNSKTYVDLGLPSGTLWCDKNVGEIAQYSSGTTQKYYKSNMLTASYASTHNSYSGDWNIPTRKEIEELFNNTDVTYDKFKCFNVSSIFYCNFVIKFTNKTDSTKYVIFYFSDVFKLSDTTNKFFRIMTQNDEIAALYHSNKVGAFESYQLKWTDRTVAMGLTASDYIEVYCI